MNLRKVRPLNDLTFLKHNRIIVFIALALLLLIWFTVTIEAQVTKRIGSIFELNRNVHIGKNEITGTVVVFNGEIDIEGQVKGTVVSFGKPVYVKGIIEEDVIVFGSNIILTEGSRINQDAVCIGGEVLRSYNSFIGGSITEIGKIAGWQIQSFIKKIPYRLRGSYAPFHFLLPDSLIVFRILAMLVIASLIVAFFPRPIKTIAASIQLKFWSVLLFGLLAIILLVPILLFLGVTIIGIPLIPIFLILFFIAGLMGGVGVNYMVGQRLLNSFNAGKGAVIWSVFVGLIILEIVKWIPLVGVFILPILYLTGLGSVILTRFGTHP